MLPLFFHSSSTLLPLSFHSSSTLLRLFCRSSSSRLLVFFRSSSTLLPLSFCFVLLVFHSSCYNHHRQHRIHGLSFHLIALRCEPSDPLILDVLRCETRNEIVLFCFFLSQSYSIRVPPTACSNTSAFTDMKQMLCSTMLSSEVLRYRCRASNPLEC